MPKFKVGDKVMFSAKFLNQCGMYTGEWPQRRGTILDFKCSGMIAVMSFDSRPVVNEPEEWASAAPGTWQANVCNLAYSDKPDYSLGR